MPAAHTPAFTRDQLVAAWQRRQRDDWPQGFDAAMANPLYGAIVRAEAMRCLQVQRRACEPDHTHPTRLGAPDDDLFSN